MASGVATDLLASRAELAARLKAVFGPPDEPVSAVEQRAAELLPGRRIIVWEGDPQTFQFSYVSAAAAEVLGYPAEAWTSDPGFWAGTVVHPRDQAEAVAYCALATGQGRDHDFQHRAVAQDGRVVVLHDVVHVIKGSRGVASLLRGIMIDVTDEFPPGETSFPPRAEIDGAGLNLGPMHR